MKKKRKRNILGGLEFAIGFKLGLREGFFGEDDKEKKSKHVKNRTDCDGNKVRHRMKDNNEIILREGKGSA